MIGQRLMGQRAQENNKMSTNRTAEPKFRCVDQIQVAATSGKVSARPTAAFELIAIVLLALSTLVAVTTVSIGIARADLSGVTRAAN